MVDLATHALVNLVEQADIYAVDAIYDPDEDYPVCLEQDLIIAQKHKRSKYIPNKSGPTSR
ncbi:hypothetical protein KDK_24550 [Dictyobacter kobayashii]|uniref:Uncharacterized protein n=1 Tax=Dictyobacter kobayashii TaxID=2014872 RepID=A0A402AHW8_9CHLR|nr:hypothetical protein KDK_24550 [Dictyobacter kobayashii]